MRTLSTVAENRGISAVCRVFGDNGWFQVRVPSSVINQSVILIIVLVQL